ncbi:hypothetical protein BCR42DRAFT_158810 [Absidia repens]|uniref:Uncharacterized protein n=1 Tax=Absidia repens TaxID=90262 RepID=A0A1X2I0U4_9FUNG|nr:hypothetical protein BCR42DRAFT_158810 [Absidia repens]
MEKDMEIHREKTTGIATTAATTAVTTAATTATTSATSAISATTATTATTATSATSASYGRLLLFGFDMRLLVKERFKVRLDKLWSERTSNQGEYQVVPMIECPLCRYYQIEIMDL